MSRTGTFLAGLAVLGLSALLSLPAAAQNGQWSTIKGRIVWGADKLPEQKVIDAVKTNADKDHCLKDGPVLDEEWVVNPKNKGLQWTFVYLMDANKKPLPISPSRKDFKPEVVIDQPICQFIPHAVALRQGQVIVAKNSAPVAHNFKWTGNQLNENAGGNVQLPPNGEFKIKGLVADRIPIQVECNIHPWMRGMIMVFDHPYYAVTDKDGNFEIKDAPAGEYNLVIRHSNGLFLGGKNGRNGQPIQIKAGGTDLGDILWK